MHFELSEEQVHLQEAARDFLNSRWSADHARRALDQPPVLVKDELWKEMADLGWVGIAAPHDVGGSESDVMTACVLAEESGRALLPGSLMSVIAAVTAIDIGGGDARATLLPEVIAGDRRIVCAIEEPGGSSGPDAVIAEATADSTTDWVLRGTKILVPDVEGADLLLVAARTPAGLGLVAVPSDAPGVTITPMRRLDAQSISEIEFDQVNVSASDLVGGAEQAESTLRRTYDVWTTLLTADLVGTAEAALELATAYAKERIQFDRPIGSFQAVSHPLADLLVDLEISRSLLYAACLALDEGQPDSAALVSAAKAFASDTAVATTEQVLHVHGGVGFTWELDVHLYLRRARAGAVTLGDADHHRDRVARMLERADEALEEQP